MVKDRHPEFNELCAFAENETEYLTAPASSRFHLCKESGLLEHSLNVAETMLKMKNTLAPEISDDSCIVTALFHDLGKAGMPNSPLYIKNISKKNIIFIVLSFPRLDLSIFDKILNYEHS